MDVSGRLLVSTISSIAGQAISAYSEVLINTFNNFLLPLWCVAANGSTFSSVLTRTMILNVASLASTRVNAG